MTQPPAPGAALTVPDAAAVCLRLPLGRETGELHPGADTKLPEDLPQVERDRVHAHIQAVGDLLVAQALSD